MGAPGITAEGVHGARNPPMEPLGAAAAYHLARHLSAPHSPCGTTHQTSGAVLVVLTVKR